MLKTIEETTQSNRIWPEILAELREQLRSVGGSTLGLFLAWLLTMISLPIANALWGQAALNVGVPVSVVLQTGLVLVVLHLAWGWQRLAKTVGTVVALTWFIEAIGTHTGLPFGFYTYTNQLQPQLGHVPLLIPLAWMMMLPVAWAVAWYLTDPGSRIRFAIISALALTAWDLFLDPQMVAWGFWEWDQPGGYFGIPWLNFAGWFLTAALITWLVNPDNVPTRPLLLIYIVTWFLESFGLAIFWGLPGPAFVGFACMGIFVVLVLHNMSQRQSGHSQ